MAQHLTERKTAWDTKQGLMFARRRAKTTILIKDKPFPNIQRSN